MAAQPKKAGASKQRREPEAATRRPPEFSVVLLGPPHVRDDRTGAVIALPEKALELIAYLVLEGRAPVRRDVVGQLLWPNAERDRAAVNLRSLLARIRRVRQSSGVEVLTETREIVQLSQQAVTDLEQLRELQAESGARSVLQQFALYRGDLFEAPFVGDWILEHRSDVRDRFTNGVARFLEGADWESDIADIEVIAAKLLNVDPYHESPYRALMRAHASRGRLRDLERVYRDCCNRLEKDLRTRPSSETVTLYRSLCGIDQIERPWAEAAPRSESHEMATTPVSTLPTVCVLAPTSSADQKSTDLVAALLEDVTIALCKQSAFAVIAPYTAWQFGADERAGEFVERFGIGYVLQCGLHHVGGDRFLTPKLIDTGPRRIIWADRFAIEDHALGAAFGGLTHRIVRSLTEAVESAEVERLRRGAQGSAYAQYLLGTRALSEIRLQNLRAARRLFKSSIRQDESFAPAYGSIAQSLVMEWLLLGRRDVDLLVQAERFAARALSLDRGQADGLREMGLCNLYQGRFDESLAAFAEAERKAPQHADLVADHADALSLAGLSAEALSKIDDAIRLNPLCPDRYHWYRGTILYQLGEYQAAVQAISQMRDQSPAYKLFAASWAMMGVSDAARSYAEKVLQIYPDFRVDHWLSMIPIRNVADKVRYEQGLRAAGFS